MVAPSSPRWIRRFSLLGACAPALALAAGGATAQSLKVNGSLGPNLGDGGNVLVFEVSLDGTRVVYLADQDVIGIEELYSAAIDGSDLVKLNPPFSSGTKLQIQNSRISPDGQWVVAKAVGTSGVEALVSVSMDASAGPFLLNDPSLPGSSLFDYEISPDSQRVVYRADQEVNNRIELYSVPIDGSSSAVKLNGPLASGGGVVYPSGNGVEVEITPDSGRVLFLADPLVAYQYQLFSAPIDGSAAPVVLNAALPAGASVQDGFDIAPDGARVVYRAEEQCCIIELFSAPVAGGQAPVKLNGTLAPGADVWPGFQVAPDSLGVAYLADQDQVGVAELYGVPIDASAAPVKLNGALVPGGNVVDFRISSDDRFVVYRADAEVDGIFELHGVEIPSLERAKVSGALVPGGGVEPDFALSADAAHVVYRADQDVAGVVELYGAPIDGSAAPVRLNGLLAAGGEVTGFQIDPASQAVVYRADEAADGVFELFGVPIAGGSAMRLNAALPFLGGVLEFVIAPQGGRVVYRADQTVFGAIEVFSVPLAGGAPPTRLNGPLTPGPVVGDVSEYRVSPDGKWLVYRADAEANGVEALYSLRLDRPFAPVRISGPIVPGDFVAPGFQLSPDGTRVVFHRGSSAPRWNLYSVPIDGSLPPIQLNGPLVPGGSTYPTAGLVQISPDGQWVVYLADQDTNNRNELFGVPIDGSLPAVKLHAPIPSFSLYAVTSFAIAPQSDRVVFSGDLDAFAEIELYSAPIDGSAGPVKLNHALTGGDVLDFQIGSRGDRVVYHTQIAPSFVQELFSVPLDLSGPAVELNGPLVPGGNVVRSGSSLSPFLISPDGARVVYQADQEVNERFEIYGVPIDGSAPPVKLNGPLVSGGDVAPSSFNYLAFRITSDGSRVVYSADQEQDDLFELFSASIAGGSSSIKLSGPSVPAGDVGCKSSPCPSEPFDLSPDGAWVVYFADSITPFRVELFAAPTDGSSSAVRLNAPLVAGGAVFNFAFTPSSDALLYVADQDVNDVNELFHVPLDASRPPKAVNGALIANGDVAQFPEPLPFRGVAGTTFLYAADQDTDEVVELYLGSLSKPLRPAPAPPKPR